MILTATIRTRPDEHAKNVDGLEMDVITATADDYDTAKAELETQVPDDWQMLSDANGYDYDSYPASRLARQQKVLNESWPLHDGKQFHARGIDDQPTEHQMPVLVRLVFEADGEDFLPGRATRWTQTHVYVVVNDPRVQNGAVWVRAEEVKRA